MRFAILETDDGLMIVEQPTGKTLEDLALERGAVIADEQTYPSYDDAYDALIALQAGDAEEDDLPGA